MILVPSEKIEQYTRAGAWGERTFGDLLIELARTRADEPAVADAPNRAQFTGGAAKRWSYAELLREVGALRRAFRPPRAQARRRGHRAAAEHRRVARDLPGLRDERHRRLAGSGAVPHPRADACRDHGGRAHGDHHRTRRPAPRRRTLGAARGRPAGAAGGLGVRRNVARQRAFARPRARRGARLERRRASGPRPCDRLERERCRDHLLDFGHRSTAQGRAAQPQRMADRRQVGGRGGAARTGCAAADAVPVRQYGRNLVQPRGVAADRRLPAPPHPFDLDVFIGQMRDEAPDYTVAAPAVLSMLLKEPDKQHGVDLSRLKRIGSGGAPVADWLVAQFADQFGIEIVNYYGSNEGAALSSAPQDVPDRAQRAQYFPRFGVEGFDWSLSNSRLVKTRLVDLDSGADIAEPGKPGELRFKGPTIFSGYYGTPELTARAFDDQGYYCTGDLLEIAGDRLQFYRFCGRSKDIVIRGGMNISSEEVENLTLGHPKVREVAVIGWPDRVMGQRVCAVVVPQPGESVELPDIVKYLREVEEVAAFKLPEKLIVGDELPRNPVGKVLKRELRQRFVELSAQGEPPTGAGG